MINQAVKSVGTALLGSVSVGRVNLATVGKQIFVRPYTGSDSNSGMRSDNAVKTLAKALSLATADKNDIVWLISESNTAASTTDYQSSTLDWNKDGVHLIGVCAGSSISNRARIALISTYVTASNLFTLSADNCIISNVSFFAGVADTNPTGCLKVTGDKNYVHNCHIAGIGHANNDIANAYSLDLYGAEENLFEDCTIGLDTIARGTAANSEIRLEAASTRNLFYNCNITTYAEAAGHQFLLVPTNGIDRYTIFKDCRFINMPTGIAAGTTMTEAFDVTGGGSPDGLILLHNCSLVGATDWEASSESAKVYIDGGAPTNNTSGLAVVVEAT